MAPSQKVTKKWEIFAGRNKFFCDGYLMTAPNSGVFYFTVILITATSGLFFVFDCPFLAQRITPAIPIIGGILFVFTLSSLFRTAFSDPGIIPRASQDEAAYIEKQIEVPNSLNSPTYRPPPRTKEVFVKGQTVKLKYCFTCKIFRPPRASHCSLCDNCVDRFDHHCPWVGNCVGKRNYRFFYMFIVSLAFLAVFIFSCTTTHIVMLLKEDNQFIDVVKRTPSSVIIAIICFCSVWSVIGLAGFHTYLTTSDQTTNEDIKGSFSSKGGQQAINPYSQGNICLNCFHILCGPITPSLIDRRGVVTDEYRTQMQATEKYNSATVPPLVVMQPGMDTLNKHYSMEHELQNASNGGGVGGTGVYRQRSYDNLQNDKSNSVAHLVENEAPLSTTGNVSILSGGAGGGLEDTTTTTVLLDEDGMELETRGMGGGPSMDDSSNQLTGSYTNLFRDSMSNGVANGPSGGGQPGKPNNSYHHHSSMMMSECDKIQSADEIINVSELMMVCSVSGHENVYSNVPPAQISPSGSAVGLLASPKRASVGSSNVSGVVDVSSSTVGPGGYQHVYSNVTSPCGPAAAEQLPTGVSTGTGGISGSQQQQQHIHPALGNGKHHQQQQHHHHPHHPHHQLALDDPSQLLSSTFISNDLDLDDPVLSSSFATATKSTANTMTKLHPPPAPSSAAGGPMVAAQQQHLKQPQAMITTIEMKNVIKTLDPNVIIQQQASSNGSSGATAAVSSSANVIDSNGGIASMHNNTTTTNNNNSHTESPMFISPSASRMRLLQESTMIDTALDLDSLDGSIGNHSQSCLVKTAIV
ncbi:palmitoyltransferase app isoform X2 [Anopheles gambiae]|uniref:palmitoyltransferase app isoform X2 n=1 Tax=Anopheles gambiae TaxID=7165 RepID=UPI002AC91C14|nr:palmitoyltransferase app isoform X2 [Anopheles gambiae]XP_061498737.1 palmitoyltransferase app isoform X2 [Anopheles gambiae]XP_061498738.1 palmitoyltransferase app isoform X2 [Anopheles gambiae]XP_061498739.1 palmitoyltransferase app isoform X2 [Anopheles gambiae]XP_061498740.1 palmitoyltransferase app isoform X2 [Anopheles gambiae]